MQPQSYEQRQANGPHPLSRAVGALLGIALLAVPAFAAGASNPGRDFPRFRLELTAGNAWLNPSGLNLLAESDDRYQEFSHEDYYNYLVQNGQLRSWNKSVSGERGRVKIAPLLGLRLKYYLFDFLAVSAGFQYSRGGGSQELVNGYSRNELSNERYLETLTVAPYRLSLDARQASVGLHYARSLSPSLAVEGFLAAGVLWATARYQSSWTYTWVIQGPNYTWTPYDSSGLLEMDGSGRCLFWEAGARLEIPVGGGFRAFLEGGYARQAIDSISGSGRESLGPLDERWEGQWRIQRETVTAPWGTLDLRTPSNRRLEGLEAEPFRLDLSGFRLRLGLSLAL
jgi:hypothetical protein